MTRQRDIFEKQVKPRVTEERSPTSGSMPCGSRWPGSCADVLKEDFDLSLQPAIGTIPTITEIGMAALLPKATSRPRWCRWATASSPGDRRDGHQGPQGSNRLYEGHAGCPVFDVKLDDLFPKPSKKVRDGIQAHNSC